MGFGDFKLPRMTPSDIEEIEVAGVLRRYQVHQLWAKIENEEVAKKLGWNYKATRMALARATSGGRTDYEEYERVGAKLRSNDLSETAQASEVRVVHLYVREFDGSISQLAFTADPLPETEDAFLWLIGYALLEFTVTCIYLFLILKGIKGYENSIKNR